MVRPYTVGKPFRFWCQKILPLVYDDSLSYYELLNKVVDYLNKVINNVDSIGEAFNDLGERFESLQSSFNELSEMVDNYFDNLDVQQEINNKLDEMAQDGTLDAIIQPLVDSAVSDAVSEWLEENVNPAGSAVVVDSSLTVSGAAADAKVTGDELRDLKSDLNPLIDTNSDLTPIYTVTGNYINRFGVVTSSANFETLKFSIPDGCNTVKVTTRTYGPPKIVITDTDATSENFTTTQFTTNASYYPAENPSSATTIEETIEVNNRAYIYVPHYVGDTSVGVHVSAVVPGRVSVLETEAENLSAGVAKIDNIVSALQMTAEWIENKYISVSNGVATTFSPTSTLAYCCTNKIRCDIFESVKLKQYYGSSAGSAFYDINGDFMQGVSLSGNFGDEITIQIPDGAYYFATTYRYNPRTQTPAYPALGTTITTESLKQGAFTDAQEKALYNLVSGIATDNPLSSIIRDGGYTALFHKIGCIGDSLASGEMYYTESGSLHGIDMYDFSWGQCMAREIGITAYNFSVGGLNAETWYQRYADDTDFTTTNVCSAYIIGLGVNDVAYADYGVGTSADINLSDKTQNADSFYGHYGKIIQRIKEVQPKAKIFCITLPRVTTNNTPYSEAIRDMAEIFSNVYIIDLAEYASAIYLNLPSAMWFGGHMTALGYQMASWHIGTYIDWIVRNNMDEFSQVQFIGTNYQQ